MPQVEHHPGVSFGAATAASTTAPRPLPAFGLMGFVGAALGAFWLVRSIIRSRRHLDDE